MHRILAAFAVSIAISFAVIAFGHVVATAYREAFAALSPRR